MTYTNFPNGLTSFGVPLPSSTTGAAPRPGPYLYVNTVTGSDGGDGSASAPWQTMGRAFTYLTSQGSLANNSTIGFVGTVREQLTAPLGVYGVSICGIAGGGVRDDNGAKWTYPASGAVAGGALLLLREQGWSLSNFLMTPEPTSGACVEIRRAEDAVYPDASHAVFTSMRFVGIDVTTTYGIRDIGGCSNIQIQDCEFYLLTTGVYNSSTAIAVPLRWKLYGNRFLQNTNDIIVPSSYALIQGNRFYSTAATEKVEISGGGFCVVTGNVFPNNAADIDPGNGYDGNATDTWTGNLVANQAAFVFGDPA
jgi:hypothetical protein